MAETDAWPTAICDAGPLIHLDKIGCLDLLADFQNLVVPEQVWEEVAQPSSVLDAPTPARHRREDLRPHSFRNARVPVLLSLSC